MNHLLRTALSVRNRSVMDDQLDWAFGSASSVERSGLCHLDLDGFRALNDSLGHAAGDQLPGDSSWAESRAGRIGPASTVSALAGLDTVGTGAPFAEMPPLPSASGGGHQRCEFDRNSQGEVGRLDRASDTGLDPFQTFDHGVAVDVHPASGPGRAACPDPTLEAGVASVVQLQPSQLMAGTADSAVGEAPGDVHAVGVGDTRLDSRTPTPNSRR